MRIAGVTIKATPNTNFYSISTANGLSELEFTEKRAITAAARVDLVQAIEQALELRGSYPREDAESLENAMNWPRGLALLKNEKPDFIRYQFDAQSFELLPEMLPDGEGWLDQLAAGYRTMRAKIENSRRCEGNSVAILYQEEDPNDRYTLHFDKWAAEVADNLNKLDISAEVFPGGLLSGPGTRKRTLEQIFQKHRAVLFLGHMSLYQGEYGWALTPSHGLTMEEIRFELTQKKSKPVPELILTSCCSGAWGVPGLHGWPGMTYPNMFLDAGVQYFVGAWMDIVGPSAEDLRSRIVAFSSRFLTRWARNPQDGVRHLYAVKQELHFPLWASLFHIYVPESYKPADHLANDPTPAAQPAPPIGGIISSVDTGTRLGGYELRLQVWTSSWSKAFWASSDKGVHIVEVLTDSWQGDLDLEGEIEAGINKLRPLHLGDGHLAPSRVEVCSRSFAEGQPSDQLLAIVYDRPADEDAGDWEGLPRQRTGEYSDVENTLQRGADIATLLAELHRQKWRHGSLTPQAVVLRKNKVVLKDTWLSATRIGRGVHGPYTDPDPEAGPDELRSDCYSLGAILYEMTTGRLPDPQKPSVEDAVRNSPGPSAALDRIVQDCLLGSAKLRPVMAHLRFRLASAVGSGVYLGEFESDLHARIAAGQRLFALTIEDIRDLDPTLDRLERIQHPVYLFEEGRGIVRRATNAEQYRWIPTHELDKEWRAAGGSGTVPPEVALSVNAEHLIDASVHDLNSERQPAGNCPIIVVPGGVPWEGAPLESGIGIRRLLRQCEEEFGRPIVMIADRVSPAPVDAEFASSLHWISFPPLAPVELFNRIVSAPRIELKEIPPVDADLALEISKRLHPISNREVSYCLRLAALEYGCLDERVAEIRELERARVFQEIGTVTYFRHDQLPDPASVGLPAEIRDQVELWAASRRSLSGDLEGPLPSRILIDGPPGNGKTTTALMLAGMANLSVVRIEPARCMMRNVGGSEQMLLRTLTAASMLHGVLVLLDDIDGFLSSAASAELDSIRRMESCLLNWIDRYQRVSVVLTAASREALPPQWRWRVHMRLSLPGLTSGVSSDADRGSVFQAVFHRCGLDTLASDTEFASLIGAKTDPRATVPLLLHSPSALVTNSGLQDQMIQIESGRDIEWWVQETLLLHAAGGDADGRAFWEDKLR